MDDPGPFPAYVSPRARVADDVVLGHGVVVHDDVVIASGVRVADGAVLGKRPSLAPGSAAAGREIPELVIEQGATISTQAIVFGGSLIGAGAIIGDQACIRERAQIGERSIVGRGVYVDNDVVIGRRARLQTNVYLTAWSEVEDDVFVGPCAVTTNDQTMARPGSDLRGVTLRRACRVGAGTVLLPGIEVGEEAFVAAGSVVTRSVPARRLVLGSPARVVREVPDDELLERIRPS